MKWYSAALAFVIVALFASFASAQDHEWVRQGDSWIEGGDVLSVIEQVESDGIAGQHSNPTNKTINWETTYRWSTEIGWSVGYDIIAALGLEARHQVEIENTESGTLDPGESVTVYFETMSRTTEQEFYEMWNWYCAIHDHYIVAGQTADVGEDRDAWISMWPEYEY